MAKPLLKRDLKTDTWANVKAYAESRILELHKQNETLSLDEKGTASTRGRIAELRALLALEGAPADEPRAGDRFGRYPVAQEQSPSSDD